MRYLKMLAAAASLALLAGCVVEPYDYGPYYYGYGPSVAVYPSYYGGYYHGYYHDYDGGREGWGRHEGWGRRDGWRR